MTNEGALRAEILVVPNYYGGRISAGAINHLNGRLKRFTSSKNGSIVAVGGIEKTLKASAYDIPLAFRPVFYADSREDGSNQVYVYESIPQKDRTVHLIGKPVPKESFTNALEEAEKEIAGLIEEDVNDTDFILESRLTALAIGKEKEVAYGVYVTRDKQPDAQRTERVLTDRSVISAVAEYYGVDPTTIASNARTGKYVEIRHVAAYIMAKALGMSAKDIGRTLERDHSTILYGLSKFGDGVLNPVFTTDDVASMVGEAITQLRSRNRFKMAQREIRARSLEEEALAPILHMAKTS